MTTFILLLIFFIGIGTAVSSLKVVLCLFSYRRLDAVCIYVADETCYSDDAMSPGSGYRCRFSFHDKDGEYIVMERGLKKKINVGDKCYVYYNSNKKSTITQDGMENSICRLMGGIAIIIYAVIKYLISLS